MRILKIIPYALMAALLISPVGAQTGTPLPPPGPYQQFTMPLPIPQHPHPQWSNIMPLPYWMQSRQAPVAQAPVRGVKPDAKNNAYPSVQPQGQRQNPPAWGWTPNGQPYQGQQQWGRYQQGFNPNYGTPNRNYGQMPPFFQNGPWNGFSAPRNPIYGYQPARPMPVWPRQ